MISGANECLPEPTLKAAKILIADDSRVQRMWLAQILEEEGHDVILAHDGKEAVELFGKTEPDLVILDINMPVMDGIDAAIHIKAFLKEQYIPIIFLTSSEGEKVFQRCIETGCDDFIGKPFSPAVLSVKINSLLKFGRLYQEQLAQKKKLLAYQQLTDQEQQVASTLYTNIIHAGFLATPELKYLLSPMALFNGDILLAAKTPGNNLHVFLGDFTGHGLSASIGATPTAEIFYGMTEKGFGINEILVEINRKMLKLLPINMFLAATALSLYADSKTLSLITCGLPDHYLYNKASGNIKTIHSSMLPLGITEAFHPKEKNIEIDSNDYLYLFTDGIIEAQNNQHLQFGEEGVLSCLKPDLSGFESIQEAFRLHTSGLAQQDDITLVELHCDIENPLWKQKSGRLTADELEPLQWKSVMEFHASTLRKINPVPIMVNALMEIQGFKAHREAIFMIVSELFTNALDHGLLGLESALKKSPEGFILFYELRQERLATLVDGGIKISFSHLPTKNGGELTINVKDTGKGFDINEIFSTLENNRESFGRGIDLVKKLCRSVEYFGNGNRVKAVYAWTS